MSCSYSSVLHPQPPLKCSDETELRLVLLELFCNVIHSTRQREPGATDHTPAEAAGRVGVDRPTMLQGFTLETVGYALCTDQPWPPPPDPHTLCHGTNCRFRVLAVDTPTTSFCRQDQATEYHPHTDVLVTGVWWGRLGRSRVLGSVPGRRLINVELSLRSPRSCSGRVLALSSLPHRRCPGRH
jgi:hypothetical protein